MSVWRRVCLGFWTARHTHFGVVDWNFNINQGDDHIRCLKCSKRFNLTLK